MCPKLCEPTCCTGCGSCRNICPKDAISLTVDEEGFLSPRVDADVCVGCKRCETVCPILQPPRLERRTEPDVYACWNVDDVVRAKSSSGGMFSVYANKILKQKGVVYGVGFNEEKRAVFMKAENEDELAKMRSSKYVQADVGTIYRDVRRELDKERLVLFSGLPCQIAALYAFLGKDDPYLLTCDLLCYGTPSPTLFRKWFGSLDSEYKEPLKTIDMRPKKLGKPKREIALAFDGKNKRTFIRWESRKADYLGLYFVKQVSLRSSCVQCSFSTIPRVGDVSLGDFWGLGSEKSFEKSDEKERGVSLNLVNSDKGAKLVKLCENDAFWFKRSLNEAKKDNQGLLLHIGSHPLRKQFVRDSVRLSYYELRRKYRRLLGSTFKKRLGKIVGKRIRRKFPKFFEESTE
ncbi:MAG: Coenzyme F420 hydrogenase/dehydrogenase, beta subunit C-terminal domain [Thermoguttaceae bacterium]|nr:Coenzyme F420 hydrogenase/dehydrogenase, beta subunit C-terminal domain [Thermoguttaceae bacterium]